MSDSYILVATGFVSRFVRLLAIILDKYQAWPCWRGNLLGIGPTANLGKQLSGFSEIWRVPIEGEGWASPIIGKDGFYLSIACHNSFYAALANILAVSSLLLFISLLYVQARSLWESISIGRLRQEFFLTVALFFVLSVSMVSIYPSGPFLRWVQSGLVHWSLIFLIALRLETRRLRWLMCGYLITSGIVVPLLSPTLIFPYSPSAAINYMVHQPSLVLLLGTAPVVAGSLISFRRISVQSIAAVIVASVSACVYSAVVYRANIASRLTYTQVSVRFPSAINAESWRIVAVLLILLHMVLWRYSKTKVTIRLFLGFAYGILGLVTAMLASPTTRFDRQLARYDLSGVESWRVTTTCYPQTHKYLTSNANPTPALDDNRIYTFYGQAGMFAISHQGEVVWQLKNTSYSSIYGVGTSPSICSGHVVLILEDELKSELCGINCVTGKVQWSTKMSDHVHPAGSGNSRTPLTISNAGDCPAVLIWGFDYLALVDPRNGNMYWKKYEEPFRGDAVAGAVIEGNRLFLCGTEGCRAYELHGVDLPIEVWRRNFLGTCVPSPIAFGSKLYVLSDSGIVTCLNTEDGQQIWRKRIPGSYYASPVLTHDALIALNQDGILTAISLDLPTRTITMDLHDHVYASPAVLNDQLIIRTESNLLALECIFKNNNLP